MILGAAGLLGIRTYNRGWKAHETERPGEGVMETKEPMPGPGRFQWNLGAWFGGQLGGTARAEHSWAQGDGWESWDPIKSFGDGGGEGIAGAFGVGDDWFRSAFCRAVKLFHRPRVSRQDARRHGRLD